MNARKITVPVSAVHYAVANLLPYVQPIGSVHYLPVVEVSRSGRVDILDGYHRIAALIAGGAEAIECVTCDDADLLAACADSDRRDAQRDACSRLYAAV
jgi:hypothetical protein